MWACYNSFSIVIISLQEKTQKGLASIFNPLKDLPGEKELNFFSWTGCWMWRRALPSESILCVVAGLIFFFFITVHNTTLPWSIPPWFPITCGVLSTCSALHSLALTHLGSDSLPLPPGPAQLRSACPKSLWHRALALVPIRSPFYSSTSTRLKPQIKISLHEVSQELSEAQRQGIHSMCLGMPAWILFSPVGSRLHSLSLFF